MEQRNKLEGHLTIRQQRLFLKKQNRILIPQDYQHVFKLGVRQRGARFTFICSKNSLPYARLGLAIAKKAIPRAVERNRVRRMIREGFRHHQFKLAGLDIVVITGHGAHAKNHAATHEDLSQQWQRLMATQKTSC